MTEAGAHPSPGWPIYDSAPPFIDLDLGAGQPRLRGQPVCDLGRPVPRPDGGRPDGVYARWTWDGSRLRAEVDPLGYYSLFIYRKGSRVMISPSILQLIAEGADPALDPAALGVFYRLGLFLNDDTPFRHIRALPAGGALIWQDGVVTAPEDRSFIPPQRQLSRAEAVDGIIEMPRRSLRHILDAWDGPMLMPLSGGRDSRHILLALDHLGRRPDLCVTVQQSTMRRDPDADSARALTDRMGIAHQVLNQPRSRPHDQFRSQILNSLCSDEHMQMMPLHDFLIGGPWAVFDGIAGDILTNPDDDAAGYFAQAARGDFTGIARDLIGGHGRVIGKPGQADAAGRAYAPVPLEETIAYVGETVARYGDAADPYQAFWFWNRTRREISLISTAMLGSAQAVFCPFLDQDYVRFCLSLPFAVTRDQQLHNEAIRKGYPAYADIPFSEGFAPDYGRGSSRAEKLRMVLQGAAVLLSLRPGHPAAELLRYLRGHETLHRRPGEVLQLHHLLLSALDADFARALLERNARMAAG